MERIKFGSERKFEIVAADCPGCGAGRGQLHEFGCPCESCPKCGGRVLKCSCKALDIIDGMKTAKAVADAITDKAEIHRAIAQGSKHLDHTYYEEGVMLWVVDDVTARDPEAAKKADELIADMGFKRSGEYYAISAEDVSKHLTIPIGEAHSVLAGLQAEAIYPDWDQHTGREQ